MGENEINPGPTVGVPVVGSSLVGIIDGVTDQDGTIRAAVVGGIDLESPFVGELVTEPTEGIPGDNKGDSDVGVSLVGRILGES